MRARNARVLENACTYVNEHARFALSAITVAEIVKGLRKASRNEAIDRFIAQLPQFDVLAVDTDVCESSPRVSTSSQR
jgi:hypothetical protein